MTKIKRLLLRLILSNDELYYFKYSMRRTIEVLEKERILVPTDESFRITEQLDAILEIDNLIYYQRDEI